MTGLHSRKDVEVSRVGEQFDMIPLSPEGVRAVSDYLGSEVTPDVSVRMTGSQYRGFMAHVYEHKYGSLSITLKRQFRGQKLSDASELSENLSFPVLERYTFGRTIHLKDHNFIVACARYGPPPVGRLYKVTPAKYAPSASLALSVGTLDYYRDIVDKDEASFTPSSNDGVVRTLDGQLIAGPGTVEFTSLGISPCWVYCTTMISGRGMSPDQSAWFKDDDKATPISSSANHFARTLGASFGVWSIPRIRQLYEWIESVAMLKYTCSGIMVLHGAVRYVDAPQRDRYLGRLHREDRDLWMTEAVFTKNSEFAPEREYRFTIWGWGPPLQDHVVMPLTNPLLACYGPSVAVSDFRLPQRE